jgi:hypothetical protein
MMVVALVAGPAAAVDAIAPGTVKSINADQKELVLADSSLSKDVTIKLSPDVVINRNGKEGKSDLKVGDKVNICHDNGAFTWTAHYVLIQEGDNKDCVLIHGTVKTADTKELVFTDRGKTLTFALGDAKVRLNKETSKIADVKVGDEGVVIVETIGDKMTLKSLMVHRK